MPVHPALLQLFVDEVQIQPFLSEDFNHVPSYGAATTYQAHITAHTAVIIRPTGNSVNSSHKIVLTDRFDIDERDLLTMPARFKVANPTILAVEEHTDEAGPHHTTLIVSTRPGGSN